MADRVTSAAAELPAKHGVRSSSPKQTLCDYWAAAGIGGRVLRTQDSSPGPLAHLRRSLVQHDRGSLLQGPSPRSTRACPPKPNPPRSLWWTPPACTAGFLHGPSASCRCLPCSLTDVLCRPCCTRGGLLPRLQPRCRPDQDGLVRGQVLRTAFSKSFKLFRLACPIRMLCGSSSRRVVRPVGSVTARLRGPFRPVVLLLGDLDRCRRRRVKDRDANDHDLGRVFCLPAAAATASPPQPHPFDGLFWQWSLALGVLVEGRADRNRCRKPDVLWVFFCGVRA